MMQVHLVMEKVGLKSIVMYEMTRAIVLTAVFASELRPWTLICLECTVEVIAGLIKELKCCCITFCT